MAEPSLDLVAIGRVSVDLYGQQIGGRLEDMASFAKAVGGAAANVAIGAARLGLRSALISRVGDEAMGRFVREQLLREHVAVEGLRTDPARQTALVLLGVRDECRSPMLFYRENCADSALDEADVDPGLVERAAAVLLTGTHFATPGGAAAQLRAAQVARAAGRRVALAVDYRPALWSMEQTRPALLEMLPLCDLLVGTEAELRLLAEAEDTAAALPALRRRSACVILCGRAAADWVAIAEATPERLEDGIGGPHFAVEALNPVGGADAALAGFLRGWLRGETLAASCGFANACAALAVSRLLCAPECPAWPELQHFLQHGSQHRALRRDPVLNHLHRATLRRPAPRSVLAVAIDHRTQMEALADAAGADRSRIGAFKELAVRAVLGVAAGRGGFGLLLDGTYGRQALFRAAEHPLWVARPIEQQGSRPLAFEAMEDLGGHLIEWPAGQIVKVLCFYHPDDPPGLRAQQERALLQVGDACRTLGREWLIEIIAGKHGKVDEHTVARVLERLYALGLKPDWWKLEPQAARSAWQHIGAVIERHDRACRGVVMLGLEGALDFLARAFRVAAGIPCVRGFAVGRSVFGDAAQAWLAGSLDDTAAVAMMQRNFAALVQAWADAHKAA